MAVKAAALTGIGNVVLRAALETELAAWRLSRIRPVREPVPAVQDATVESGASGQPRDHLPGARRESQRLPPGSPAPGHGRPRRNDLPG